MSIQETRLLAIADAIREREGSSAPIPAGTFAARIRGLQGGLHILDIAFSQEFLGQTYTVTGTDGEIHTGTVDNSLKQAITVRGDQTQYQIHCTSQDGESCTKAVTTSQRLGIYSVEFQAPAPHIYGVQWDGGTATRLTRTDEAAGFSDPSPAVSSGSGSSPFDTLRPWSGMVKSKDSAAGTVVAIPKFYYKWTKSGNTMKLQIANKPVAGFLVSPAHGDRGDGMGERDVVYVGRYHCLSTYRSAVGASLAARITRAKARTNIHNLGPDLWQFDLAMLWTIRMLYLVEFADWDSQAKIGYGCSISGSKAANGQTDQMQYHTGTTATSHTTYGFTQYRNIEGLWDNLYDWVDGCYYDANGLNVITNPNHFSDSQSGVPVGKPVDGYPSALSIPTEGGLDWALYPSGADGNEVSAIPDRWGYHASNPCLYCGGYYHQDQTHGLFFTHYNSATYAPATIGCRLMKLP